MAGWKSLIRGRTITCIALQETHVSSEDEAEELAKKWSRMWGKSHDPQRPISFWSITSRKAGGTAFLLHPKMMEEEWRRQEDFDDGGRCLVIETADARMVNVYAPNYFHQRERFYDWLATRLTVSPKRTHVLGDFNCVLQSAIERVVMGKWGPPRSESPALERFLDKHGLSDALTHDPTHRAPITTITYWQGPSGARLDRCYVSHRRWVVATENLIPHQPTDHCGVVTWLRDPEQSIPRRPLEKTVYPIRGRDEDALDRAVGAALVQTINLAVARQLPWDSLVDLMKIALNSVQRDENRRAKRQRKKREARQRKRITTLQELIAYVQARVERKSSVKQQAHILERSGNSAQLFRRFVQLDQRSDIRQLIQTVAAVLPTDASLADIMACEWESLLGQRHATVAPSEIEGECAVLFTIPREHVLTETEGRTLQAAIELSEVQAAIDQLGRHKAAGPDRLSNDFYKDWGTLLVPTLTALFNDIMCGGRVPDSFAEAIVVPIPKTGDRTNALNYRPISLLQSGYKIFTKVLANRVQHSLGKVINADQNGFVRGRALADNITLMRAILHQAHNAPPTETARGAIVLIDFKKAYDTIDRDFLWYALRSFGYPEGFVTIIQRLHEGTTARFLVNGDLSYSFDIVTGIRQGCPLAPLLFLIAAETLKHAIDKDPGITGIRLKGKFHDHTHSFSAFVDDSVVYLGDRDMVGALEQVLERFGRVSGLHAQPHKSHALLLGADQTAIMIGGFPVVPVGATVTYLGTEIGITDLAAANWSKRMTNLTTRMGVLSQYTTGVLDRVQIINLACVPSLLFTAQFFTPSPEVQAAIDATWRQFIWKGTVTASPQRTNKISRQIMELPRALGGLGVYDYRGATIKQAAASILRWNARSHDKYWEAFAALLPPKTRRQSSDIFRTHPASDQLPLRPRLTTTAATLVTAQTVVNTALRTRYPHPTSLTVRKQELMALWPAPWQRLQWRSSVAGWIRIPDELLQKWTALSTEIHANLSPELRTFWSTFPWRTNDWIRDEDGCTVPATRYAKLGLHTLKDIDLKQQEPGLFQFRNPVPAGSQMRPSTVKTIARWIRMIIVNTPSRFGDLLCDTYRVYACQASPIFDQYEWQLHDTGELRGTEIARKWKTGDQAHEVTPDFTVPYQKWLQPTEISALSENTATLTALRELQASQPVLLVGHAQLQHGPTLLPLLEGKLQPRTALSRVLRTVIKPLLESRLDGLRNLHGRLEKAIVHLPQIGAALQRVRLSHLHYQHWGLTSHHAFFWYRLVIGGLNLRDDKGERMACPYDCCSDHDPISIAHVVWSCPAAQRLWGRLYWRWAGADLQLPANQDAAADHIFSRSAPKLRPSVQRELGTLPQDYAVVTRAVQAAWTVLCSIAAHNLWLNRNDSSFRHGSPSADGVVGRVWATIENHMSALSATPYLLHQDPLPARLMATLWRSIKSKTDVEPSSGREARLYFDGGARGNPGTAGSGTVLAQRYSGTMPWEIIWWRAEYAGDTATNNYVEHLGLLRGVQECHRRYGDEPVSITIIGDSALILAHVAGRARSTHDHLHRLIKQTTSLLARLSDVNLQHTLRAGNKTADRLANHAMDTRTTSQATSHWTPFDQELQTLLSADIHHPTTPLHSTYDLLNEVTRVLHAQEAHVAHKRKRD